MGTTRTRARALLLGAALLSAAFAGCDDEAPAAGDARPSDAMADAAGDAAPSDGAVADTAPPADAAVDQGVDASPDQGPPAGPPACNDAYGPYVRPDLPADLVELAWDDGTGVGDVSTQAWSIVDTPIATADLYEAVRFDLPHPAQVHAISVQYGALPDRANAPVLLGLYGDFGHNGFDFWAPDPLWEGARCAGDITPDTWVTFTLREPVVVEHPGLVYVAHRRDLPDAPAWRFDGTPPTPDCGDDCCAPFEACHSAWNFPQLRNFVAGGQRNYAYNGLSTTFQYDYLVRLHVTYTDAVQPEDTRFQALPDVAPSNRVAWGDYDADGWPDLITNGPRLWRNVQGTLQDVTEAAGLAGLTGSGVWGDFDNDGCPDLFLFDEAYNRSDRLLRNTCEGSFEDVTAASGIADLQGYLLCDGEANDRTPTPAAAWLDLDGDGLLDLYVANFICWSAGQQYVDQIWRNNGDGTFSDWTGTHGFWGADDPRLASRGAAPIDHDLDGDVDLLVSNYRLHRNLFFRNTGDGTVEELGLATRLAGRRTVQGLSETFGHTIGSAWGDLNGDGVWDVVQANLAHPRFFDFSSKTEVLLGQGDGTYLDLQGPWDRPESATGLRYQETHSVPALADFDNDGHLDLAITAVYPGRPTDFYWGNGDGTFRLDAYRAGLWVTDGWGLATADVDRDGRQDLASKAAVFHNQGEAAGHWLEVAVVGDVPGTNRLALGATVRVYAGDRVWLRHVSGGDGQGGQASPYLHVGLGDVAQVDRIEVRHPGGEWLTYAGPFAVDQRWWLLASGAQHAGFDPPAP